jgi:hypothetical protein
LQAECSGIVTVNLKTDPDRMGVEDCPRTVTYRQFKKTLLYIIDDFREIHKKSELKIVKSGYVRGCPK